MGGSDPATTWNNAYQQHADDTIDTVRSYSAALRHFADVLNVCGWNWDTAEYNANRAVNKGAAPPRPTLNSAVEPDLPHVPDPDNSAGIGLIIDPLTEIPLEMLGTSLGKLRIPSGDTGKLDTAATAWTAFANSDPMDASSVLLRVSDTFVSITAPEVMDIQEILVTLENGKTAIWNAAKGLAEAAGSYRDELTDFRTKLAAGASAAFPHEKTSVSKNDTEVRITLTGTITDDINSAVSILRNIYTQHPLSGILGNPVFDGTETADIIGRTKAIGEIPIPAESGNEQDNTRIDGALDSIATWDTPAATLTAADLSKLDPAIRAWAESAVKYGNQAGIDPRLVMAIVANEGATRTLQAGTGLNDEIDVARYLSDPARVAAGFVGIHGGTTDGNSLGLTNMKEDTFNAVKKAFPDQFKNDDWHDLIGNNDLAIKASTYNLKRIENQFGGHIPASMKEKYTLNQFLAASYNAGDGNTRTYIQYQNIGPAGSGYSERAMHRYERIQELLCNSGAYTCS
jgi:hypothetical protein